MKPFHFFQANSLRVHVCNLNLAVYVFPGVVTVQLSIVCSNYKVQVANQPDQIGTNPTRLPTTIDGV